MLETSKDVLNLLIGFSVLWVALWFSWILYQVGRTLKGVNDTISIVKNIADNVNEGISTFKSKAGNAAAFLTVLTKAGQEFTKKVQKKRSASRKKTTKTNEEK
ncbi:hypothetical protein HOB10_03580 [Candidatus Parcubacteria bacterium]|jgi:hypothetical protein|nr:hypothetical protein [Candidatus Parcubacteria bacterium]